MQQPMELQRVRLKNNNKEGKDNHLSSFSSPILFSHLFPFLISSFPLIKHFGKEESDSPTNGIDWQELRVML